MSALAIPAPSQYPQLYTAARAALFRCDQIDECAEWSSKAAAIESYARQARDETLKDMATRIQARAVRRMGELLKSIPNGQRVATAEAAGVSRLHRNQAVSVAQIPAKAFEKLVESASPPKVYQLALVGRKPGRPRKDAPVALTCCPTCGRAL